MAIIRTACVGICLLVIVSCDRVTCPSEEDLYPCTCRIVHFGSQVVCRDFNDTHSLLKASSILRDYRVNNVHLHNLHIKDYLPSDIFDGLQIKELMITMSQMKFTHVAFAGLDTSLYVLTVAQHSNIRCKDGFSLARLTKLTELNIKSAPIGKVENSWLNDKVPSVKSIVLDENEIIEVEDHAFANLPELQKISMADNRIKAVKRTMFPRPATLLHRIDLSSNEIRILPHDIFFDMPSLKEVVLPGNDLYTLPEKTWIPVWEQLTQVLLADNKLICDKELDWIKKFPKPAELEGECVGPENMDRKSIKDIYNN